MDHGILGRPEGLENLEKTLDLLLPVKPQGVLVNPGVLPRVAPRLAGRGGPAAVLGLNLHLTSTMPQGAAAGQQHRVLGSLEQAAALGADCVKLLLIFGDSGLKAFADNMAFVASTVEASQRLGIPVMVEPTVWAYPDRPPQALTVEQLAHMARIAVELGADILKIQFAPPADEFRTIIEESPVPVVILGGVRSRSAAEPLEVARQAVAAGAAGLVFGRNVWQQPDPAGVLSRLVEVVHGTPG
ncbi:MAG: hypothetical protein AB1609_09795 [Bacillota bacterium]